MDRAAASAFKLALIYVVFASLWILFSDLAVETMLDDPQLRAIAQTYKGLAFVIITALLLLIIAYRDHRTLEKVHELDGLTGLHSLKMFISTLEVRIQQLKPGQRIMLGYLDIDDFKSINEAIGYERADSFLVGLADDIRAAVLPGSFVARLHADQFASFTTFDENTDMTTHVQGFQQLFAQRASKQNIPASCCIGVAIYPMDGSNAKELMVSATEALKVAKQEKNSIQYHDISMTERTNRRRQLELDLQAAIANEQLTVVYQPKYNLKTMQPSGLEVLVRWIHKEQGFIPPDVFIPLAEETGLSTAISRLVISKASKELQGSGILDSRIQHVAFNVSATEFNDSGEMEKLADFIQRHTRLGALVRIEITETATLTDMQQSAEVISRLQASGMSCSIDDFGTGYTSLAMLKDLTIDEIKIDRSFVSGVEQDHRSRTIVEAIIAMAKSFRINIVGEGVETAAQLEILQQLGCQEAQGYFLGRPVAIDELITHLTSEHRQAN